MTIVAIVYAILVIQFTNLFKENRYFLELFALSSGVANFLVYRYLPDSFFKPNTFFVLNILNLLVVGFVVQITGGLTSPFAFFYTIIILSAIVTMSLWRTLVVLMLTLELIAAHFLTASNLVAIEPGSINDLLFNVARVLVLAVYSVLLVSDLYTEEEKNLAVGSQLREKLDESNLTSNLDRSVATREPLGEILEKTLAETAKEFKAEVGLLLLKDELGNSWKAGATHQLTHDVTSKINPEVAENEIMKIVEKSKKTTLLSRNEVKKTIPSLKPLNLSSALISPLVFKSHLFGAVILMNIAGQFSAQDKEFLDSLTSKYSATISNALSLESQDHLFMQNEQELEEAKKELALLKNRLKEKELTKEKQLA